MHGGYVFDYIPGLEAFMEDDSLEKDAYHSEADIEKDLAESEAEGTKLSVYLTMFTDRLDEMLRMHDYVSQYGVNRAFLTLCNYDNRLGLACGITFPVAESFAIEGNPYSAESIAVLEGIGGMLKSAWDWVVKIARKVYQWLVDRVNDVRSWVEKMKKQLRALSYKIPGGRVIPNAVLAVKTAKTAIQSAKNMHWGAWSYKDLRDAAKKCEEWVGSVRKLIHGFHLTVAKFRAGRNPTSLLQSPDFHAMALHDLKGDVQKFVSSLDNLEQTDRQDAPLDDYSVLVVDMAELASELTDKASNDMLSDLKQLINARSPNVGAIKGPEGEAIDRNLIAMAKHVGTAIRDLVDMWDLIIKAAINIGAKAQASLRVHIHGAVS